MVKKIQKKIISSILFFLILILTCLLGCRADLKDISVVTESITTTISTDYTSRQLKLLSYIDKRNDNYYIVEGKVQNKGTETLDDVIVFIEFYDSNGKMIKYKKSSIEVNPINPGEISDFIVAIPESSIIVKYWISFQFPSGEKIKHIDVNRW